MTKYLLDENVIREFKPSGHKNVLKWRDTIDDSNLRVSVMTLLEKRNGAEALKKRNPEAGRKILDAIDLFEEAYEKRIVDFDKRMAAALARYLAGNQKNRTDLALAATASVKGWVMVTRNIKDIERTGVKWLNPFTDPPETNY